MIEALLEPATSRTLKHWRGHEGPTTHPCIGARVKRESSGDRGTLLAAGNGPDGAVERKQPSTPLHWAAYRNENPAVIEALLAASYGPDGAGMKAFNVHPCIKDGTITQRESGGDRGAVGSRCRPDGAERMGHHSPALGSHHVIGNETFSAASHDGAVDSWGTTQLVRTDDGKTPLHWAALTGTRTRR